ncbi:AAA family ATPase [Streptomyces sp. NPDC006285]|uniref:AAA family ATPase n=1 Tax=Streptomyces sp. NPDC006285 TaxID=3364742 RepID=UPI00367DEF52
MRGLDARPRHESASRALPTADVLRLLESTRSAPATVEIHGEPWIGKTRLLHQVLEAARGQGWAVAHAAAGPLASAAPYQLFSDAFEEALADRGEGVTSAVPAAQRATLSLLFPALAPTAASLPAPSPDSVPAGAVGMALRPLLRELAGERGQSGQSVQVGARGLVLALDDVHRADPASLDLLENLVRRPPGTRLLILVAHRDRQSPLRLRGLLSSVPASRRIEVGPLPEQELTALLPKSTSRRLRRNLLGRAGGNPGLFLALSASPDAYERTTTPDVSGLAPFTRFLDEFRAVSDDGWLVAQSAAILGERFTLQEMPSVAALPADRLAAAFAELLREDIVRPGEVAGSYRFRHPVLCATAYHTTGEEWRLAAHSAAAQLVRLPGPCAHVAPEATANRAPGAGQVRSGLLTGDSCHALGDEAGLYGQRVRTGKALVVAGRPKEALEVLDRTARAGLTVPLLARAEAAEWRARAQRLLGRHALAESVLMTVRAEMAADPEALALVDLAWLAAALERGCPPSGATLPSLRWAVRHDDALTRAYAWALLGAWDTDWGRTEQAEFRLGDTAGLLDGIDDTTLIGRLDALYWLGRGLARLEQDEEAARHFERGLGIAAAHDLNYLVPQFATGLAEVCLRLGRVDLAVESGRRADRAAHRIGGDCLMAEAGAGLSRAAWVSGDQATARDAAQRAADRTEAWREPWADRVRLSLLETTYDLDDQGLRKRLMSMGAVRRAAALPVVSLVPAVGEVLARLEWESRLESEQSGPDTEAGRWAAVAEEAAGRLRLPGATGLALLARAHHHQAADPLKAAVFASSAVVALTRAGRPLDVVRAHLAAATAWHDIDSSVARSQFGQARALLDGYGAHGYLEHTDTLATQGPRQQSADARLTRLSGREREISVLVSDGYTNQQIARALQLSHKTVETHLGRIFRKLDVGSRAQVATSIGRASRIPAPRSSGGPVPARGPDRTA